MRRFLRLLLTTVVALSACLAASEMSRRLLDGYYVFRPGLERNPNSPDLTWADSGASDRLLRTIKLDIDVDPAWFYERPPTPTGAVPDWAAQRAHVDPAGNYVWNAALATDDSALRTYLTKNRAKLGDVFTFTTPTGESYPRYRLYPQVDTGLGLTNRFGWRSRDLEPTKPADVVRIAMLGDSTTNAYPRLVEHWLNIWAERRKLGVRFEVINAARPGTGALDAAAIMDFEFSGVDPDYIVVYGFGNDIHRADALIELPPGVVRGQPESGLATVRRPGPVDRARKRLSEALAPLSGRSAAAAFLRSVLQGQRGGRLAPEPPKPPTKVRFPTGIDEFAPDPDAIAHMGHQGLMLLDSYLQALNRMDAIARARHIRLFISTFRVLAFDGMLLDPGNPQRGAGIDSEVNQGFWWPYTYAEIHRIIDFYNRTLRAWASRNGRDIIPVNEEMPWRPELYGDAMHERFTGEALHGWIVFQHLLPRLREDLASHRLPRRTAMDTSSSEASTYWKIERRPVDDVLDSCMVPPATAHQSREPSLARVVAVAYPDALPLARLAVAYDKARLTSGAVPVVRTASESSSYAAFLPLAAAPAGPVSGGACIEVNVRVMEGRIALGVLNKAKTAFLATSTVAHADGIQSVRLFLEDISDASGLMIANNRPPGESGPSVAEIHGVILRAAPR